MESGDQKEILERAQLGDAEAFRELLEIYWGPIVRWLQALTRCAHTAEDLAQEAFLKAWVGLPRFHPGNHFPAWLFRIARNCWIDHQRQRSAQPLQSLPLTVPAPQGEPIDNLQQRENASLLEQACEQLPEICRAAFLLWSMGDLPYKGETR